MATVDYLGVDKIYPDGTCALEQFTLGIQDGEMMVLLGPSGCGKSTALRLLAGLDSPSAGDILIDGKRVNDTPPQQRNIAMVFQNYALYPHMTVRRNIEFPLRMLKVPRAELIRRVELSAQLLGLEALMDKHPRQLSGGQRQRVAMGRAIVRQPQAFLMDEPLSNLDARLRIQIRADIAMLQRRLATTTLYVTHDQVEAMTLGDRIAILHQGKLQQVGAPQAIYDQPANVFVATFLGSPGMNIIPAMVSTNSASLQLADGASRISFKSLLEINPRLADYSDQQLLVGLRPESFCLQAGAHQLEVTIETVESLGHEFLIHFSLDDNTTDSAHPNWIARMPGLWRGDQRSRLKLGFSLDQLYFFDQDGAAIV